jgi:hypothetical protein
MTTVMLVNKWSEMEYRFYVFQATNGTHTETYCVTNKFFDNECFCIINKFAYMKFSFSFHAFLGHSRKA